MQMLPFFDGRLCYGTSAGTIVPGGLLGFGQNKGLNRTKPASRVAKGVQHAYMNLEQFLTQVEKRAYRMAQIATSDSEDALDIVQDAMMTLATRYASRDAEQWPPLFHRILQNRIRDWYRRQKVRNALHSWFGSHDEEDEGIQSMQDESAFTPERLLDGHQAIAQLEQALQSLPLRQQQTFLLRNWEGLDTRQTAEAMGISTGSVKTHYARALQSLQQTLGEPDDE